MTTTTILIVAGIASAFLTFGFALAWCDFTSRNAPRHAVTAPPFHR